MKVKRKGLLIPVLLLIALLLVLCLAELGRQPYQYRAAQMAANSAQARFLAEAGLEDFHTKWNQDFHFPPASPLGTSLFTYEEPVKDFQTGQVVGYYRITVDDTYKEPPYQLYKVTSEGMVGASDNPICVFLIKASLDIQTTSRGGGAAPNPNLGSWIEWRESAF